MKCSREDFINAKNVEDNSSPMRFFPAHKVAALHNIVACKSPQSGYASLSQYAHLRENSIDLEAIALVFYGGVKKARAALAMKISQQALDKIIRLALNKIEESLTR